MHRQVRSVVYCVPFFIRNAQVSTWLEALKRRCSSLCTVKECVTSHTGQHVVCSFWSVGSCTASYTIVECVVYAQAGEMHGIVYRYRMRDVAHRSSSGL